MQKIITKTGKEYAVDWCGLSTIDHALRFELSENVATITEAFPVFSDPEETEILTHVFDENKTVYEGYTKMRSIEALGTRIALALRKEE